MLHGSLCKQKHAVELNMKKTLLFLVTFLAFAGLAAQLVPVEIINRAEDTNGRVLVSKFREIIRKSSAYEISYDKDVPHFSVQIDTMDRYKGDSEWEGLSTIYHYMILINNGDDLQIFCSNQLGYVGNQHLDQVAYEIYSALDDFVEMVRYYSNE